MLENRRLGRVGLGLPGKRAEVVREAGLEQQAIGQRRRPPALRDAAVARTVGRRFRRDGRADREVAQAQIVVGAEERELVLRRDLPRQVQRGVVGASDPRSPAAQVGRDRSTRPGSCCNTGRRRSCRSGHSGTRRGTTACWRAIGPPNDGLTSTSFLVLLATVRPRLRRSSSRLSACRLSLPKFREERAAQPVAAFLGNDVREDAAVGNLGRVTGQQQAVFLRAAIRPVRSRAARAGERGHRHAVDHDLLIEGASAMNRREGEVEAGPAAPRPARCSGWNCS